MTCVINFAKACFHVDKRRTWDHLVDASIRAMKYLNGPDKGWMGPQMSPWIRSRNFNGSACILRCDGLKINFPFAHDVHIKSEDYAHKTCPSLFVRVWKNLTSLSIVLVAQLSTSHISSSIGLPPVTIRHIAGAPFSCSVEELLISVVKCWDKWIGKNW
jgi:hypothetical protein